MSVACVAGVRKGRGREKRARDPTRSRAPKFPLPHPLLKPATQAKMSAAGRHILGRWKSLWYAGCWYLIADLTAGELLKGY